MRGTITRTARNERENVSIYNITLSTLRRPYDDAERQQLEGVLDQFQDYLTTPEGYDHAFGSIGEGDRVHIDAGTPEVGNDPRGSRVHIHFVATTYHEGLHNAPEIQQRIREAFIEFAEERGVQLNGAYAYVQVDARSYMANYIRKGTATRAGTPKRTQYLQRLQRDLRDAQKANRTNDTRRIQRNIKQAKQ